MTYSAQQFSTNPTESTHTLRRNTEEGTNETVTITSTTTKEPLFHGVNTECGKERFPGAEHM